MTIGRPQGAVWIGKPLDLTIPLTVESSELGESLCLGAEVMQGDTPIAERNISVRFEPNGGNARMRIRTSVVIEEPTVSVNVRAGCEARSIRNYMLLADVPSDVVPPTVVAPPAPRAAVVPPANRAESAGSGANGSRSGAGQGFGDGANAVPRSRPAAPRAVDPDAAAAPRRQAAPPAASAPAPAPARRLPPAPAPAAPRTLPVSPPAPAAAAPAQPTDASGARAPRLRLDTLDPAATITGGLRTESRLSSVPVEDPARRAEAAAQWRAINGEAVAAPAAIDAQRIQVLEQTLAVLREQSAQNQRALLDLRNELAQERDTRYRNPLIYALVGLLLLALIGLLLLWRRVRQSQAPAWWGEHSIQPDGDAAAAPVTQPPSANAAIGAAGGATIAWASDADDEQIEARVRASSIASDAADAMPTRSVSTEELFDVQQQSDFFLSLGQHEQAIAVLEEHIAANPGTSALAYLDLLRIFHSLGRRADYVRVASEFERAFNADLPAFDQFADEGRGLEHYGDALARIQSLWPSTATLALIEELVFRKPGTDDEAFDLSAYQELLLLYSVAKEVIDPHGPDSSFSDLHTPRSSAPAEPFADTFVHSDLQTRPAALTPEPPRVLEWEAPELMAKPASDEVSPIPPETRPGELEPWPAAASPSTSASASPSIYREIDDELSNRTVIHPLDASAPAPASQSAAQAPSIPKPQSYSGAVPPAVPPGFARPVDPAAPLDLADFDRTTFETMPSPLEAPAPAPDTGSHPIDFELFDPATEAEIAPKPKKR